MWALGGMALILLITYFIWNLHTLLELFKNKMKVENELERSSTLIHCVTELSANQDVDEAINHLLEIINQYFKSDRTYILKLMKNGRLYIIVTNMQQKVFQRRLKILMKFLFKLLRHGLKNLK